MAELKFKISADYEKVQRLRDEITKLKQEIKGVDAIQDPTSFNALNKQLESAYNQLKAIQQKMADEGARIVESANRIDKAVEKITQAQNSAVKAAKQSNDTSTTKAQAEAVEGQAKAYVELKDEIDAVLGTREQNIRKMIQEQNAIRLINAEIAQINKSRQYGSGISQVQAQRLQQLNDDLLMHKHALAETRQELNNNAKLDIAVVGSMNELSQSLSRMRIAYRALDEDERNSKFGQDLLASIQEADVKIKELDATIGNHQRNVGNYQGSFGGLNMSVQQIVRELPSATMGVNMFFMAISNNLPIMADQIKYAKEANKAMKAAGQEPVPIWKQLTASIFSWQTAMMVGITLLTVYGKDIKNWVSGLFNAKTAINDLIFAQRQLREASKEAQHEAVSEQTKLKTLYAATQDTTIAMKDRLTAVKAIKEQYPSYFSKLSNEAILAGQAAGAYRQLAADILKAAQARAMEKRIEKLADQNIDLESSNNADKNWRRRNRNAYYKSISSHQATDNSGARAFVPTGVDMSGGKRDGAIEQEWNERESRLKKHTETLNRNNKTIELLTSKVAKIKATHINLENQKDFNPKKVRTRKEDATKQIDYDKMRREQSDAERNLEISVAQSRIDAMQEGYEKERAQRELNHKKELEDIEKQRRDFLQRKRDEAKSKFEADPKNKGKVFNASSVTLSTADNAKFDEMIANAMEKHLHEGASYEDKLIREHQSYTDKRLELERKYSTDIYSINQAIKEAETRNDNERVEAFKRSLLEVQTEFGKSKMSLAFEQLKKDSNYVAAFDDLKGASTDTLNSLIGRFSDVKQAAGEALNPEGVKTYFDAINGMIDELISRDPIGMIKKLTDELIKQQDELKAAENRRDRVKGGEKIVKSIGYNKDLKKWVSEYWELADAEADVAAKGQQVAQTTNKIVSAHKTLTKTIQGVADKMGELGGKIGGQTGEIFSLFGSVMTYYQTISDGVTSIGKAGSNAMKAIESSSVILAIISAAIQLMKTLSSVLPNQDDLYEKAARKQAEINKLRDSVNDYRLAVMKARHEERNWFSDSGLKGLQDAYEEHGQVAESYYKKLNEAQEKYINKSSGLKKALVPIVAGVTAIAAVAAGVFTAGTGTAAIGALGSAVIGTLTTTAVTATVATAAGAAVAGLAGAIVGKAIDAAVSSITYKDGQVAAKDNLRIQTRHKSFWRSQKTADLKEWVKDKYGKDLFGEDGMVDKELANEVLKNYGNKLQGETKETLEKLVELREKYDEFNKSIHEYVSKMYSPLVSDMTDAVWSWLKDGKDALSEFKNSASKTFAEISKDMVKQLLLKNVFSQYEDKLSDLYKAYAMKSINENELGAASAQLAGEIVDGMNSYLPVAQNLLKQLQEGFAAKGIDITKEGDSSQTATANGVTTITFEQASNIVALTTAGNISRDQIKERLSLMNATMDDIRALMSQTFSSTPDYANSNRAIINNSYTPQIQVSFPKEELQNINGKIGTILAVVDEMRTHGAESLMEQKALSRDTEKIVMGNKEMLSCVNDFRRDFNKQY